MAVPTVVEVTWQVNSKKTFLIKVFYMVKVNQPL